MKLDKFFICTKFEDLKNIIFHLLLQLQLQLQFCGCEINVLIINKFCFTLNFFIKSYNADVLLKHSKMPLRQET